MSTKRLMIALGVLSIAGCEDSAMNLGPGVSTATGGSVSTVAGASSAVAGATGSTLIGPAVGGAAVGGAAVGGAAVGGAAVGGAAVGGAAVGGATSTAGTAGNAQAGAPTINGLNLTGLKRFSLSVDPGGLVFVSSDPLVPCKGKEPTTYSVDLESKTYEYAHCAAGTDGGAIVAREPRILSEEELTAGMMMLEQISLDYQKNCFNDGGGETLVLDFPDRQESYRDDFSAGCTRDPEPLPTYVANMDWLSTFLSQAQSGATIPADYDRLEIRMPPQNDTEVQWVNECGTSVLDSVVIDFTTKQASESRCERSVADNGVGPAQLIRSTLTLNDAQLAGLREQISQLKFGATRQCSGTDQSASVAWLGSNGSIVAHLADARAACPGQSERYSRYTLGLNSLYSSVLGYFRPLP